MRSWDLCARGSSPSSCGPLDRTVFAVSALYIPVDHVAGICVDETPGATAGRNGCVHRNMLLWPSWQAATSNPSWYVRTWLSKEKENHENAWKIQGHSCGCEKHADIQSEGVIACDSYMICHSFFVSSSLSRASSNEISCFLNPGTLMQSAFKIGRTSSTWQQYSLVITRWLWYNNIR
jgi:hypothetical protein